MTPTSATSGRLPASDDLPKGLAPLSLGERAGEPPVLTVEARDEEEVARLRLMTTPNISARLTVNAAAALAQWLDEFSGQRVPELIGLKGIQEEFAISRGTVRNWSERPGFPPPVPVTGGGGPVWEASSVRDWVRRDRPKVGVYAR